MILARKIAQCGPSRIIPSVQRNDLLNRVKDNTVTKSFNGHFKPGNHSPFLEADTPNILKAVVGERMRY